MPLPLLLAAAAAAWQVAPLVLIERSDPVLCGYHYTHPDGLELRVEKGVRGGAVFTAIEVRGAVRASLRTRSFDSERDLRTVSAVDGRSSRQEGDLQEADAGGALFAELGVSGGMLRVTRASDAERGGVLPEEEYTLPAPLPRGVTAMYLNCAGDLIRPEP